MVAIHAAYNGTLYQVLYMYRYMQRERNIAKLLVLVSTIK